MYKLIKLAFRVSDMANKASSDYLMSLCPHTFFEEKDGIVFVYAVISQEIYKSIVEKLPVLNIEFENNKIETEAQYQIDILNGTITPKTAEELYVGC